MEQGKGNKKRLHLMPDGDEWVVRAEGSKEDLVREKTKAEADREGRKIAKKREGEFIIHGQNWVIQDSDSYGNDPRSSKDNVH